MRFCAFREYGSVATGFVHGDRVVSLDDLNDALSMDLGPDLDDFLQRGQEPSFRKALAGPRTPTSGWPSPPTGRTSDRPSQPDATRSGLAARLMSVGPRELNSAIRSSERSIVPI